MRKYEYKHIKSASFVYEYGLLKRTNKTLVMNFNKIAKWIEENCPRLTAKFMAVENSRYWVKLIVESGKAYLEEGSWGYRFSTALSSSETAVMTAGSSQVIPYAFKGVQFFDNEKLEGFIKNWHTIKPKVINENEKQTNAYSEDFEA